MSYIPVTYEQITGTDGGVAVTAAKVVPTTGDYTGKHAIRARLTCSSKDARYIVVSGSAGTLLPAGSVVDVDGKEAVAALVIKNNVAGQNAVVDITYFFAPLPFGPLVAPNTWTPLGLAQGVKGLAGVIAQSEGAGADVIG